MLNRFFGEADHIAHYECGCGQAYRKRWTEKPWFDNYNAECPRCGVENEPLYLWDASQIFEIPAGPDLLENCDFGDQLTSIEDIEKELHADEAASPDCLSSPAENGSESDDDRAPEW